MTTTLVDIKLEKIIELYNQGLSHAKIAENTGYFSGDTVGKCLRKAGIKGRSNKINSRRYFSDEDFFECINTEEKAYWLGFIYADGFITNKRKHNSRRLGISLGIKDIVHLEKFKKSINSDHKIYVYRTTSSAYKENTEYCRIIITSEKICDDIERLGVLEHKSLVLTFPNKIQLPSIFKYHFIRGYFDGDGSITITNNANYAFKLCGTKELFNKIKDILGLNLNLEKRKKDKKNNYSLSVGGNRQVERILDLLYSNANIYLDRKYSRYMRLKDTNIKMDEHLNHIRYEQQLKDKTIIDCYNIYRNNNTVSSILNCSTTTVDDALERNYLLAEKREEANRKKKATDKKVLEMYLMRVPKTKIAKALKMSCETIQRILGNYGYLKIEAENKECVKNNIIELFKIGKSKSEIRRQTGCSRDYIRKVLKEGTEKLYPNDTVAVVK